MNIPTDHPFQPGVRVAIKASGLNDHFTPDTVKTVRTRGHFTLESSPTRSWRPFGSAKRGWEASETVVGDRWHRRTVLLWDDARVIRGMERQRRRERFAKIRATLEAIGPEKISDALLDAIEAALVDAAKAEGKPE